MLTIRERCLDALHQRIRAALEPEGVTIYRNRRRRADFRKLPVVNLVDGGQSQVPEIQATHFDAKAVTVFAEGYLAAGNDDDLGPAASALYGQIIAAALADPSLGNIAIDVTEGEMEQELVREEGSDPGIVFALQLTILFATTDSDPYTLAP